MDLVPPEMSLGNPDPRVVLEASLGNAVRDSEALRRLVDTVRPDGLEASVRGAASGVTGGRMMIERASAQAFAEIGLVTGVRWTSTAQALVDLARGQGVPTIAGWDAGGAIVTAKAYLNASDTSGALRDRIAAALGLPMPAHVVGVNVGADGSEALKLYVQSADTLATLSQHGPLCRALAASSERAGVAAGAVVSYDVVRGEAPRPRAAFVALRDDSYEASETVLRELPGYSTRAVRASMPFEPGPPRSVGLSLRSTEWTVYAKPLARARSLYRLEPCATFRAPGVEVGIFVEPITPAARSYGTTARHAVSYRVLEGTPSTSAIEALMSWVLRVVEHEETRGPVRLDGLPPAPWTG